MKRAIPVTRLFPYIGGVLLSDEWDHHARRSIESMRPRSALFTPTTHRESAFNVPWRENSVSEYCAAHPTVEKGRAR
ncbi:MAG: hypothetical protein WA946_01155 [Nitrospirota bacterium]